MDTSDVLKNHPNKIKQMKKIILTQTNYQKKVFKKTCCKKS